MNKTMSFINILVLIIILGGGMASFFYLKGNQQSQLLVGIATSIAYMCWGVLHHWLDKTLHRKVVIEYLLLAFIAILLLCAVIRI